MAVLVVFGALAFIADLDGRAPESLAAASAAFAEPPATFRNWQHLDTGQGFGFYAPIGVRHARRQGVDSAVGEIATADFRLQYDFGFYSNALEGMRNQAGYREYETRIDGRRAIIRKAILRDGDGPRYLIGLYIERADWVWAQTLQGAWRKLGISGVARTERDRDMAEQLFTTIRFDRPLPVTIRR